MSAKKDAEAGLRFNEGKLRYDLLEPFAMKQLVQVFTKGSLKYNDRNWEKGMNWSTCLASLKRHIAAFESGEDYDFDPKCEGCKNKTCKNHTGELHITLAAWNAMALTSYYKIFPEGDDRTHDYLKRRKIGLDIDEVICDWVGAWIKEFKLNVPTSWFFDYKIISRFEKLKKAGKLNDFYLNLKPKINPIDLPFEPHCYVTSRPVSTDITIKWLEKHNFPTRPVITVPVGGSKVEAIKAAGVEIFVDDRYDNFVELNKAGICTYLMDAPHNHKYNVGHKRIFSLHDLM